MKKDKKKNKKKKNKKNKIILYNLLFFLISFGIYFCGYRYLPHDKKTPVKCEVLKLYDYTKYHKSHAYNNFILILKTNNKIFDVNVTPVTYYNASKNKYICLNLSHYDIYDECTSAHTFYKLFMIIGGIILLMYISFIIILLYDY